MIGPLLAGLLGLAGLVVAWLPGRQRWWRIAVPLAGVLPVMAAPMLPARDTILQLEQGGLDGRSELAALAYVKLAEAEAAGLIVVAITTLLFAMVSGLKSTEDVDERIARAVSAALALGANAVLVMIVIRDFWLIGGQGQDPMNVSLLILLGAAVAGMGVLWIRGVTEKPDHFAIQLVAGIMVACTMLLLRVPTHFAQERLLQHTEGGQILAVERRYAHKLPTAPEGTELAVLNASESLTGDDWGWYSTSLGDPIEMPTSLPDPVQVALPIEAKATLLVQAPWGETERELGLLIQQAMPTGEHPFTSAERYRTMSFLWMPEVLPTWSPDFPILPAEGSIQDLVDACVEAREQRPDDPCRIARIGPSPEPLPRPGSSD